MIIKYICLFLFTIACTMPTVEKIRPLPAQQRHSNIIRCTEQFILLDVEPMQSHKICTETFKNK